MTVRGFVTSTAAHERSTTVRLRASTRARLNVLAEQLGGRSVDETVSTALDVLERQLFWQEVQSAHARRTQDQAAEDAAEMALWDEASSRDYRDAGAQEAVEGGR